MWIVGMAVTVAVAVAGLWWAYRARHRLDRAWWQNLSAAGWRLVAAALVLIVVAGTTMAAAPPPVATGAAWVTGLVTAAAVFLLATGRAADPARRRHPMLVAGWFVAGLVCAWAVGFQSAAFNDPAGYTSGAVSVELALRPVRNAAPFMVAVWLAGVVHLRWLAKVRARNRRAQHMDDLDREMA